MAHFMGLDVYTQSPYFICYFTFEHRKNRIDKVVNESKKSAKGQNQIQKKNVLVGFYLFSMFQPFPVDKQTYTRNHNGTHTQ